MGDDFAQPGYGSKPEQSAPITRAELLEWFALLLAREPAVYATVFQREVAVPFGAPPPRLIVPVTDSPETTFFHVRLQQHPLDAAGIVLRAAVNLEGFTSRPAILAHLAANGSVFTAGALDDFPVMRKRRQPITVDLVSNAGDGRMIVEVYDMRRVAFAPQSMRAGSTALDGEQNPARKLKPRVELRANA